MNNVDDVITGSFFIVPNSICSLWDFTGNSGKRAVLKEMEPASYWADAPTLADSFDKRFRVQDGDLFVQVWFVSDDNDNWADHRYSVGGELFRMRHLPLRALEGLEEGDTLSFRYHGQEVRVVAEQAKFRYSRFGKFEDLLTRLVQSHAQAKAA